jgi:FKBP-type peptidyl-prolyl cis-trans isomerase|tara:strand:+ start:8947 stop:9405 length:459 start_codon:yes stop_codon:yes gene_type:complete
MSNEITTETGLVIETLEAGTGETPSVGDRVLVHYEIWVGEGVTTSQYNEETNTYENAIYDSTYDESNPFNGPIEIVVGRPTPEDEVYTVGDSIKGLDEALLRMKVGGKLGLMIPPDLGYGALGASSFHSFHGYRQPPGMAIRCNIELVEVKS